MFTSTGSAEVSPAFKNKNFRQLHFSGFGDFINIIGIVGFCLEFGREEFLYTERVLFVSVRQVFVIGMLRNVVFVTEKRSHLETNL